MTVRSPLAIVFLSILITGLHAQNALWRPADVADWGDVQGTVYHDPVSMAAVEAPMARIRAELDRAPHEDATDVRSGGSTFHLPMPDGTLEPVRVVLSPVYDEAFAARRPDIATYSAYSPAHPSWTIRLDVTPHGFHGIILGTAEGTVFIDPYEHLGRTDRTISYLRSDYRSTVNKVFTCDVVASPAGTPRSGGLRSFGSCERREYRLAVAATGEYTAFHGGTVALAEAAQVTTMNRVNGIFERDLAVRMNIIGNNDLLVYTNAATDPYTNGATGAMINENQTNVDAVIGDANYDVGHVFGTNSGGLAGLGVVCFGGNKARGVTGGPAPVGDPFDVDYVAHEFGHQFGANHTQNNDCNRNNATAMEVGSGSTIMSYAGICAPNVQPQVDDHYHSISVEEMGDFITGFFHTCPVEIPLANNPPSILSTTSTGLTIPANTPFALTATATDPDPDVLTYAWEQIDNGIATMPPTGASTNGPNFETLQPTISPTRYFPNLADLAAGVSPTWEVLPTVSRTMDFRLLVRDNAAGGGCNDHADISIDVDDGSGPFVVTDPNTTGIVWTGGTTETITWSVAGTDAAPVSCTQVNILLSTDGGLTYTDTLAAGVPNSGSQSITVPGINSTTVRILVQCANGLFFDISDEDLTINTAAVPADFAWALTPTQDTACHPSDADFTIDLTGSGGFSDPVTFSASGLPAGWNAFFTPNSVVPPATISVSVTYPFGTANGAYPFTIDASAPGITRDTAASVRIAREVVVTDTVSGCDSVVFGGSTVFATSVVRDTAVSSLGCDSIRETRLEVVASTASAQQLVDCDSVLFGGAWYTASTVLRDTLVNAAGCDSVRTTDIVVQSSNVTVTAAAGCDSVLVGGSWYTASTSVFDTLVSGLGCDSVVRTDVSVASSTTRLVDTALCDVASYTLPGGGVVSTSGIYRDTLVSASGCDSIIRTDLTLGTSSTTPIALDGCDSLVVGGSTITADTVLTDVLTSVTGCDSTVVRTIAIHPSVLTVDAVSGCDSVLVGGAWVVAGGSVFDTLTTAFGCDSVIRTDVSLSTSTSALIDTVLCGSTYLRPGGGTVTVDGTYFDTLVNAAGCDSVVESRVSFAPTAPVNASRAGCDSVVLLGTTYTSDAIVFDTLTASTGCDSVVRYAVDVTASSATSVNRVLCDTVATLPDGTVVSADGVYQTILTASNGCDSVITTTIDLGNAPAFDDLPGDTVVCRGESVAFSLDPGLGYGWFPDLHLSCDSCPDPVAGPLPDPIRYYVTAIDPGSGCTRLDSIRIGIDLCGVQIDRLEAFVSQVSLQPNPTTASSTVRLTSLFDQQAAITVLDLRGRVIWSVEDRRLVAGATTDVELPAADWAPAMYMVVVQVGDARGILRLVRQ